MMVGVTLRFLIEQVGQVEGVYPTEGGLAENFILRRTASHGIELLGIMAFRASPIWVLAALADVTGGSSRLMREITDALKEEGLLDADGGFETMEQVLGGLEKTTAHLAVALNMPPVNVSGLRREWQTLKTELQSIPPQRIPALSLLEETWDELRIAARTQNRTVFTVSSLLAISTLAHVPANVLWLSRATRSAARRTTEVIGRDSRSLRGSAARHRPRGLRGVLAARVPSVPARRRGAVFPGAQFIHGAPLTRTTLAERFSFGDLTGFDGV